MVPGVNQPGPNPPGAPPRADWYPDPTGRYEYRYFNGVTWTADVSRNGVRSVDTAPMPVPGTSQPASWVTTPAPRRSGKATAALVLGIVALALSWVPFLFVVGGLCGILAIVYGVIARRANPPDPRGFAGVGIVLGAASLVVCALGVFLTVLVMNEVDSFTDPPDHDVEITRCARNGSSVDITGSLTNVDDRSSEYLVFVRTRAGGETGTAVIDVGRVAAGSTETFTATLRLPGIDPERAAGTETTCVVTHVTGPYPFGVALSP